LNGGTTQWGNLKKRPKTVVRTCGAKAEEHRPGKTLNHLMARQDQKRDFTRKAGSVGVLKEAQNVQREDKTKRGRDRLKKKKPNEKPREKPWGKN